MPERFLSEPLKPVAATCDTRRMAGGEPGLPSEFIWRGETITLGEVLRSWKETGPCSHGSGELYVRKHWYEVHSSHGTLKIYFERQPRGGRKGERWWLYTMNPTQP